jgi:hypothetical protein
VRLAILGTREERLFLIRDTNRIVARNVMESPKLSESEVEIFASLGDITEDVFRAIASNRTFMKSYGVVRALINNPHVPLDVTLGLIIRLNERDLKIASVNKNLPTALRNVANKLLKRKQ